MKTISGILALTIGIAGCASAPPVTAPYDQEQKKRLVLAQMLIEDKKTSAAKELLLGISGTAPVKGVTDEALFRLALLNLEAGEQKITTGRAGKNLDRILNDFSTSSWQPHAATLKGLMDAYDITLEEKSDLERTIRSLRSANLNLSRENRELRQDLEKLKNLELELELKTKK